MLNCLNRNLLGWHNSLGSIHNEDYDFVTGQIIYIIISFSISFLLIGLEIFNHMYLNIQLLFKSVDYPHRIKTVRKSNSQHPLNIHTHSTRHFV